MKVTDIINAATQGVWFTSPDSDKRSIESDTGPVFDAWSDVDGSGMDARMADCRYVAMANPVHFALMQQVLEDATALATINGVAFLALNESIADVCDYRTAHGLE